MVWGNDQRGASQYGYHNVHVSLIDAVIAGDAQLAHAIAREHLLAIYEWTSARAGSKRTAASWLPMIKVQLPDANAKLARLVADQLVDEIITAGWPVGQVLGSK